MKRAALDIQRFRRYARSAQRLLPAASGTVPGTCPTGLGSARLLASARARSARFDLQPLQWPAIEVRHPGVDPPDPLAASRADAASLRCVADDHAIGAELVEHLLELRAGCGR